MMKSFKIVFISLGLNFLLIPASQAQTQPISNVSNDTVINVNVHKPASGQNNNNQKELASEVRDIKFVFLVDAYKYVNNNQLELPQNWPKAPLQPIYKHVDVWEYPAHLRKDYKDKLEIVGLKDRTNYSGTCEQFISDKSVLSQYQKEARIMQQHLGGKGILVRLICIDGENVRNVYQISGGKVNAMYYDPKRRVWRDEPFTRPLTQNEIRILERIDFKNNFDAIGRYPKPNK